MEVRFRVVFGTIAIMAALVSARSHIDDPTDLLEILISLSFSLIAVHTFSDYLSRRFGLDRMPTPREIWTLLRGELPLLAGALVPVGLYALAAADLVGEGVAYGVAVGYALTFLFVAGYLAARPGSLGRLLSSGAFFASAGPVVVAIEASIR